MVNKADRLLRNSLLIERNSNTILQNIEQVKRARHKLERRFCWNRKELERAVLALESGIVHLEAANVELLIATQIRAAAP